MADFLDNLSNFSIVACSPARPTAEPATRYVPIFFWDTKHF
jgi:hypothetical protein